MNDIAGKIFFTSTFIMFVEIALMKFIGEYKDTWYQNTLTISFVIFAISWFISGIVFIWTR